MSNKLSEFSYWLKNNENASESTIESYLSAVRNFLKYYHETNDEEFIQLMEEDVKSYWFTLIFENFSKSTLKGKLFGLKKFNQFLIERGYQSEIVVKNDYIKITGQNDTNKENISITEVGEFLRVVNEEGNRRDIALIMLKLRTEMSIAEIINLKLSNIIDCKKIIGMNKEQEYMYLDEELQEIISKYIQYRATCNYAISEYLFVSNKSEKLKKRQIFNLFRKYSLLANLKNIITPKKLGEFKGIIVNKEFSCSPISFSMEAKEVKIFIDINFITNDFKNNLYINFDLTSTIFNNSKKYSFIMAKPEAISSIISGGKMFPAKGWIFTNEINEIKIKKYIESIFAGTNGDVEIFNKFLEDISTDISSIELIK